MKKLKIIFDVAGLFLIWGLVFLTRKLTALIKSINDGRGLFSGSCNLRFFIVFFLSFVIKFFNPWTSVAWYVGQ